MSPHCVLCEPGHAEPVALFRVNATGRPGVWACLDHIDQTDAKVAPELRRAVQTLKDAE